MGQIYSLRNALRTVCKKIDPSVKEEMIAKLSEELSIYATQAKISQDESFKEFVQGAIEENNRILKFTF